MGDLIYTYGVITSSKNRELTERGFNSRKVFATSFKDISAIVSRVPEDDWSQQQIDKNVKDMRWLEQNAPVHEGVIESVMQRTTIIPMNFCTIFRSEEGVKAMLQENYHMLKDNLEHLDGKVEMGVKVYFNPQTLREQLLQTSEEIKCMKEKVQSMKPGAAYFMKKEAETLVKELLDQKAGDYSREVFRKLKPLALEAKATELLKKEVTGREMLLNGAFLIRANRIEDFKQEVTRVGRAFDLLHFEISGPFPPYSFVKKESKVFA